MILLSFWQLILVYSSMVLPPAWVIVAVPTTAPHIYAVAALFVIYAVSPAT